MATLTGGLGNDSLNGGAEDDTIIGAAGNDTLNGAVGNDTIDGGADNDVLGGGAGNDSLLGGDGNDNLQGAAGDDTLDGGAGADTLGGAAGNDLLTGGDGNDVLASAGGAGGDPVNPNPGVDTLLGGAGDDTLTAGNFTVIINGAAHPATSPVVSFAGASFDGGDGTDYLGVTGHVDLRGAAVANFEGVSFTPAQDTTTGPGTVVHTDPAVLEADCAVMAGLSSTASFRGTGTVSLEVTSHSFNGSGYTFEAGSNVAFAIEGTNGADTITGTSNGDTIGGADGDDLLTGGAGADVFRIDGTGVKVITDFVVGQDKFDVSGPGFDSFDSLKPHMSQVGVDTKFAVVVDGTEVSYTLKGVSLANLAASDFIFNTDTTSIVDSGGDNADFVPGAQGADTLSGAGGNDTLNGFGGADSLVGGAGDDRLVGGTGDDTMAGGVGNDTYVVDSAGDVVVEAPGEGTDTIQSSLSSLNLSRYANVEVVTLTNAGGATAMGTDANETFNGGAGADSIDAGGGNDILGGGPGANSLSGGLGDDTLSGGVGGGEVLDGGDGNDILITAGGQGADSLIGGAENDVFVLNNFTVVNGANQVLASLTGDFAGSSFDGGAGTDTLAVNGHVAFKGAVGSIEQIALSDARTLPGAAPGTFVHFDASLLEIGPSTLSALPANTLFTGTGGVIAHLDSGAVFDGSQYQFAAGSNVAFTIEGSAGADSIVGTSNGDTIDCGAGDDTLTGGGGADVFRIDGLGAKVFTDFVVGQDRFDVSDAGFDTLDSLKPYLSQVGADTKFATLVDGVEVSYTLKNVTLANLAASDFIFSTDTTPETDSGGDNADFLSGAQGGDTLSGGGGADTLNGFGGADSLSGGAGDDRLVGGSGDDTMAGGLGNDTYIVTEPGDVIVEAGGEGTDTVLASANSYTLAPEVENMTFTGTGGFAGTGNASDNVLTGGTGTDALDGAGGNDTLIGGAGRDTLVGGTGDDLLVQDGSFTPGESFTGGDGVDTLRVSSSELALQPNPFGLIANAAGLMAGTVNSVERVEFASLAGHALNVLVPTGFLPGAELVGGAGADQLTLVAMGGGAYSMPNYTLTNWTTVTDGSAPSDSLVLLALDGQGPQAGQVFNYNLTAGAIPNALQILVGASGADSLTGSNGVEALIGNAGNDLLNAQGGDDSLNGGDGDDILVSGAGHDVMIGGAGFDRIMFTDPGATQGAEADLATQTIANDGFGNVETMSGVEQLGPGTVFVDKFYGSDVGDLIAGSTGDFLYGRGGDDTIVVGGAPGLADGGDGVDSLRVANQRQVAGPSGPVTETSNVGVTVDLAQGKILDDGFGQSGTIANFENLAGTSVSDKLTGDGGANQLYGNGGADTLDGAGGADLLFGGDGNDVITGGDGVDTALFRGAKADYQVTAIAGGVHVVDTNTADGDDGDDDLYGVEVLQFADGVTTLASGVNITGVMHVEGNGGATTNFNFTVTRDGDVSQALTLPYTVAPSGADPVETNDLVGFSSGVINGMVTFAAGSTTATISVPVVGDATFEGGETFSVTLGQPATGVVTFLNQTATGTIVNDDNAIGVMPIVSLPPDWSAGINFGDPHLSTLDGLRYDMQGVGEFVLVESTAGAPLSVQIRTEAVNAFASEITEVATRVGTARLTIDASRANAVQVDGQALVFQPGEVSKAVSDGVISHYNQGGVDTWLITYSDATKAALVVSDVGDHLDVTFAASPDRQGQFHGLLGNFNGQAGDDLALRNGTALSSTPSFQDFYSQYVASWRISQAESLLDYGAGQTTATFTNAAFPPGAVSLAAFPTDLVAAANAAADAAGITDPALHDAAVLDFLLTGDASFVSSGAAAGGTITKPAVQATITGAPAAPVSVGVGALNAASAEGSSGETSYSFKIFRTDAAGSLNVDWKVAGATFLGAGGAADATDFSGPTQGTVTFAAGETEKLVVVKVVGDTTPEANEGFELTITPPAGTPVISNTAQALIINDDAQANRAPVVTGPVTGLATEDGAAVALNPLGRASDPDAGTVLSVANLPASLPAGVSYNAGTGVFSLNPANAAYQSLAAGATTTVTVNYAVSDGQTSTPASVSWTVTGVNDAPTVSGAVTGQATENGAAVTVDALSKATDVDAGTVLHVVNLPASLPAGVTYNALTHSFTLDPSNAAFSSLNAGQTATVTVDYGVSDGSVTVAAQTTFTIAGVGNAGGPTGTAGPDNLKGGDGSDTINGLGGADTITGGDGADRLIGGDGADSLNGGDKADTLAGGAGSDTLTGGDGSDVFQFGSTSDAQGDLITDFKRGADRIDLSAIDAVTGGGDNAFAFIGGSTFSHVAGQLRAYSASGSTYVEGDVNGDGTADFSLRLQGVYSLQSGDFIL